jgi:hypothetical protein
VSNDHDIGILEDTVEFRDQLLLSRSIHCKLFPVWRSDLGIRRLRPAALPALTDQAALI